MATSFVRKRIAILGGGMAGLSAALELTSDPDWKNRYDITLFQLGWRLGGKGASSRNPAHQDRIEEHGLHVWFGCYETAFRLLRRAYDELARPASVPFHTLEQAFQPRNATPYMGKVNKRWAVWPVWFPPNPRKPGTPGSRSLGDDLAMFGAFAWHLLSGAVHWIGYWVRRLAGLRPQAEQATEDRIYRFKVVVNLGWSSLRGIIADRVWSRGMEAINGEDMRAWLKRHGATEATLESAPVRALYDLYMSYLDGDTTRPSLAAGVGLAAIWRLVSAYKGAVLYEMQAGMGEVVIAPIYQVLQQRGVRFEFFHRVKHVELDPTGEQVARVRIGRQARLKGDTYQPLISIKNISCWPHEPLYDQLAEGDASRGHDLESKWSGWPDVDERVLEAGADFDQIVLAISLAEVRIVCADLERMPAWKAMVNGIPTIQTQSIQLWMTRKLGELGWRDGAVPMDAAPEPFDVWADRSEVLQWEGWSGSDAPLSLQYLCGAMKGNLAERPASDTGVPDEAHAQVRETALRWIEKYATDLWPRTVRDGQFEWDVLLDSEGRTGPARLDAQYWSANIDPTERYVLSPPDTTRLRLGAGDSGLRNLVLAGDWTRTTWNVGCIEAAALSGVNAAREVIKRLR